MRPAGKRDSAVSHRTFRISLGRRLERTDCFPMVKSMIESEPLVEVTLRLGRISRDFAFVFTQSGKKWLLFRPFFCPNDAGCAQRDQQRAQAPAESIRVHGPNH